MLVWIWQNKFELCQSKLFISQDLAKFIFISVKVVSRSSSASGYNNFCCAHTDKVDERLNHEKIDIITSPSTLSVCVCPAE